MPRKWTRRGAQNSDTRSSQPLNLKDGSVADIRAQLLGALPPGVTSHSLAAKKLLAAFREVSAELHSRSTSLGRSIASEHGTGLTVLGATHVDRESVLCILRFVHQSELQTCVSALSRVYNSLAKLPTFWTRLDFEGGFACTGRRFPFEAVAELFSRPQFSQLRWLSVPALPGFNFTRRAMAAIAPHLTALTDLDLNTYVESRLAMSTLLQHCCKLEVLTLDYSRCALRATMQS